MNVTSVPKANNTIMKPTGSEVLAGSKRVVTAELSLEEIGEIREHIPEDMEIGNLYSRQCVFLFRRLSSQQLSQEEMPTEAPAPIRASEIFYCGREKTGRIYAVLK